jgi:hypothetical protein
MKTVLSIPLILLILFSGISVKFATHFCHGSFAATKVSLTGELATCGMETLSGNIPFDNSFGKHCCDDITSAYSICNNYVSSSSTISYPWNKLIQIIDAPFDFIYNQLIFNIITDVIIKPPGTIYSKCVSCAALCVFRI